MVDKGYELARRLETAHAEGNISDTSLAVLSDYARRHGAEADMGTPAETIKGGHGLLITMLVDDSGSIGESTERSRPAGLLTGRGSSVWMADRAMTAADAVIFGHNAALDGFRTDPFFVNALAHTRYLNGNEHTEGKVLFPYRPLAQAVRMTPDNFYGYGGTPLYDEVIATLTMAVAKAREFHDQWKEVFTATLILTDGQDQGSREFHALSVRPVIEDMFKAGVHIVAGMAIGGDRVKDSFREMGIKDNWILDPDTTPAEIANAMKTFGKVVSEAGKVARDGGSLLPLLTAGFDAVKDQ